MLRGDFENRSRNTETYRYPLIGGPTTWSSIVRVRTKSVARVWLCC